MPARGSSLCINVVPMRRTHTMSKPGSYTLSSIINTSVHAEFVRSRDHFTEHPTKLNNGSTRTNHRRPRKQSCVLFAVHGAVKFVVKTVGFGDQLARQLANRKRPSILPQKCLFLRVNVGNFHMFGNWDFAELFVNYFRPFILVQFIFTNTFWVARDALSYLLSDVVQS